MRLFVAINFSPGTRSRLLTLRDELRSRSLRGNFSAPENLHLTLAFLGECDAIQTTAAKAAMDGVNFAPFPVEIERLGRFRRDGGDIWWAGVRESRRLLGLQRDLTDKLVLAGLELEQRKYSPHITLGRQVQTDFAPTLLSPFGEIVSSIELMKSERTGGKLCYTAIYEKAFKPHTGTESEI